VSERGGLVGLPPTRPQGLPLLQPPYAPPRQYTDDAVLVVASEAEEAAIRNPETIRVLS
jgi:hypothetical protein